MSYPTANIKLAPGTTTREQEELNGFLQRYAFNAKGLNEIFRKLEKKDMMIKAVTKDFLSPIK